MEDNYHYINYIDSGTISYIPCSSLLRLNGCTPDTFFLHFQKKDNFLALPVCYRLLELILFRVDPVPSKTRSTLKGKNSRRKETSFFPFRVDLFSEGRQAIWYNYRPCTIHERTYKNAQMLKRLHKYQIWREYTSKRFRVPLLSVRYYLKQNVSSTGGKSELHLRESVSCTWKNVSLEHIGKVKSRSASAFAYRIIGYCKI